MGKKIRNERGEKRLALGGRGWMNPLVAKC